MENIYWHKVQEARKKDRPGTKDFIHAITDTFIELHGDRYYRDDKAVIGGIGSIGGRSVTILGIVKGKTTQENMESNFGMVHPEGYRKALRLMKQADKFNRPIITFIDTPGAYPGIEAEERGQGEAIARNLQEMFSFKVPILTIILGEAGSGGALGLAVANQVWILENGIYCILSPEGFASILYKDASKAPEIVESMKITSDHLLDLKIVDKVISEENGLPRDMDKVSKNIREDIISFLDTYTKKRTKTIQKERYERFRSYGEVNYDK